MKNILRKAIKAFKQLGDALFLAYGQQVTAAIANAVATFGTPTPSLDAINKELSNFAALMKTAASRDKVQVAMKNASKLLLKGMLSQLTDYVNLIALGNETILAESSMQLSKIPEPVTLKAPTNVTLSDGPNTGEMKIKCKGPKGAVSFIFTYSTDPLMLDATTVNFTGSTTSYTFSGLTKSKVYYCSVAAVGANKQVFYSNIVNRSCQ
jgi:hypothetical protein